MAYKTMKTLINNYKNGKCSFLKEKLADMCDVYFGAGRLTNDEYTELIGMISELE